ncbi:hypothetical protein D9M68_740120 [compost metagenome]
MFQFGFILRRECEPDLEPEFACAVLGTVVVVKEGEPIVFGNGAGILIICLFFDWRGCKVKEENLFVPRVVRFLAFVLLLDGIGALQANDQGCEALLPIEHQRYGLAFRESGPFVVCGFVPKVVDEVVDLPVFQAALWQVPEHQSTYRIAAHEGVEQAGDLFWRPDIWTLDGWNEELPVYAVEGFGDGGDPISHYSLVPVVCGLNASRMAIILAECQSLAVLPRICGACVRLQKVSLGWIPRG